MTRLLTSKPFDFKNNSFDFIRFLLAIMVIVSHTGGIGEYNWEPHIKMRDWDPTHTNLGTFSVYGFFIISGFLITRSFLNTASIGNFIANRIKRVYPGFVVSLFFTSFLFIPLYFFLKNGFDIAKLYSNYNLDITQYFVKNIFIEMRKPTIAIENIKLFDINGPYWTLIHEVRAYFLVLILGFLGILNKRYVIIFFGLLLNTIYSLNSLGVNFIGKDWSFKDFFGSYIGDCHLLILFCYFIFGMLFYLFQEKIIWNNWIYAISILGLVIGWKLDVFPIFAPTCFTYVVLYSSQILPFQKIVSRIGDLSYGIYIYSWPIQICLLYLGLNKITGNKYYNYTLFAAISIFISMMAGYLSWNLVEKRWLVKK